jgi:RHS repeat-associated protein
MTDPTPPESQSGDRSAPGPQLPTIALPKGGGAIRGIDEKFTVNPATGTASLSVPVFTSPGRSGFGPQLSLAYDSGAGNGPFGLGWRLSIPSISRKTDKGLPRYQDPAESDVYILSGAEDLVPAPADYRQDPGSNYDVYQYRPRVEGLFSRIERWVEHGTGDTHWRAVDRQNVTSLYGLTPAARIADPADPSRVYSWLLEMTYDDRGNVISYEYKQEDAVSVDRSAPQETSRLAGPGFANRYLKNIWYANRTPYQPGTGSGLPSDWAFQVVFDYGEHDPATPTPDETAPWPCRADPFSTFRPAFEIRTYRLCRRVLMFHSFPELGTTPCLVRSTDLGYDENPVATTLAAVTQTGYIRDPATGSYQHASFPALTFTYAPASLDTTVHDMPADSLDGTPAGLATPGAQLVDLDSVGLPGILVEQKPAWLYKQNLGAARFTPGQTLASVPTSADLRGGRQQFLDLAGDGRKALVDFARPQPGFYERDPDSGWAPFTPFASCPNLDFADPNLRLVDLDGDGLVDILLTQDDAYHCYLADNTSGFVTSDIVPRALDEDRGPTLLLADPTRTVYLADMTGDGLTDLVQVRNGSVCYWPNCGYGRFAAKITMDGAPLFDRPDIFAPRRLRLADVDGSGTTDLIYLGADTVTVWFNQAGNSFSSPHPLKGCPPLAELAPNVTVTDLLGQGTACLVWSSPLPADVPMRYLDLMGGSKPYLLDSVDNNMGKKVTLSYQPSTVFYAADYLAGLPWITNLPFPVHVVTRVQTDDQVAGTSLVTSYRYHHGHYDGVEREFRGFGMVEQWDTEDYASLVGAGLFPENAGQELYAPPVHTKTWYHTGVFMGAGAVSRQFAAEYWPGDPAAAALPDTALPSGLTPQEAEEACRALKGHILRQEIYADDNTSLARNPYQVTEHTYGLRLVQRLGANRHAVIYALEQESLTLNYERDPADPRLTHTLTLAVDDYGTITQAATVGYPRRPPRTGQPPHEPEQDRLWIAVTEHDVTNVPGKSGWYRIGVPVETRRLELTGATPEEGQPLFSARYLADRIAQATGIAYDATPDPTRRMERRVYYRQRTLYKAHDLTGPLTLGLIDSLALADQTLTLALTPGLAATYPAAVGDTVLHDAGYVKGSDYQASGIFPPTDDPGDWWAPGDQALYSPAPAAPDPAFAAAHFYLLQAANDPFGNLTTITWDPADLLPVATTDPLQTVTQAQPDYRVLGTAQVTDPNGNQRAAAFDELGLVIATAVMGKPGDSQGDTLIDPTVRISYDLFQWQIQRRPNLVHTMARERHHDPATPWQEAYAYSDGFGRIVMTKTQAAPGAAPARKPDGSLQVNQGGTLVLAHADPRWIGSGRTVFDNKSQPVMKYEPFFSSTPAYESERDLVQWGVTPVMHYDPAGRLIRTDFPNGTLSRVSIESWTVKSWDQNDTVLESLWHTQRQELPPSDPQRQADDAAVKHANTPTITHLDPLGRIFLSVADNGPAGLYPTRFELDVAGNHLVVRDPITSATNPTGRPAMISGLDMLSRVINATSIDAGARTILSDIKNNPVLTWDARGIRVRRDYDQLRRPTAIYVMSPSGPQQGVEVVVEQLIYGESQPHPEISNLRTRVYQHLDQAGSLTNTGYDFKGNLLSATRQLLVNYHDQPDWSQSPHLKPGDIFTTSTAHDALNRTVSTTTPDQATTVYTYNPSSLVDQITVTPAAGLAIQLITNVDYNARGQRLAVQCGNGTITVYTYDPDTFRLDTLTTTRASDGTTLQQLTYTYDPVGNITCIQDSAQQTIFFNNMIINPVSQYTYDAVYRLIQAAGREHIGQTAEPQPQYDWNDFSRTALAHPNDGTLMRTYTETYTYDSVGNILTWAHTVPLQSSRFNPSWTRNYSYDPASNRLQTTSLPDDLVGGPYSATYTYDANGNMTAMPYPAGLGWDWRDQMHQADLGGGGSAWYVYDGVGQRVRKVWEKSASLTEERIYLGGYEVYRRRSNGNLTLQRQTLRLFDDKHSVALIETTTLDTSASPGSLPSTVTRYQYGNHLGSAVLELDDRNAAIISYEEYYPYGGTSYQGVPSSIEVSLKRYRFTGKERDEETGLYYHGARYYASWLGRWISADKQGLSDGPNLYEYVHARPIVMTDPSGNRGVVEALALDIEMESVVFEPAGAAFEAEAGAAFEPAAGAGFEPAAGAAFEAEALSPLAAEAVLVFLTARRYLQRSASLVQYGNPYNMPTGDLFFQEVAAQQAFRSKLLEIHKLWPESMSTAGRPVASPKPAAPETGPRPTPTSQVKTAVRPQPTVRPQPELKPEQTPRTGDVPRPDESKPGGYVFLDTGALIALAQRRPDVVTAIGERQIVTSLTAFGEFTTSMLKAAGPTETAGALVVREMLGSNIVPDIPSERVAKLIETDAIKAHDKLIFGSADALRLEIITGDARFVNAALEQGVNLNALPPLVPPPRFSGR